MRTIKTGSDFSGVGAFDFAIERVCKNNGWDHERVYACDWDKYARITYAHNHGKPVYFPKDVYDRQIPADPLTVYMTSPPCQAFSLAGKRLGKEDERGILFFNSHQFIQKNSPRYFIFENVKGLLSHDNGRTFQEWLNYLGGKSINGQPVLFPDENATPYHIYWKVINAKDHGVPQNRERVFIVGIREDQDNSFRWPVEEHLVVRLEDVLDQEVEDKYFLSEKMMKYLLTRSDNFNGGKIALKYANDTAFCINSSSGKLDISDNILVVNRYGSIEQTKVCLNICANYWKGIDRHAQRTFVYNGRRFRKLTPAECFRLMDFPSSFDHTVVSDTQAYMQAGNSIVVRVLEKILQKLI